MTKNDESFVFFFDFIKEIKGEDPTEDGREWDVNPKRSVSV
jgi:hypothetical protein